ncbi:MAG: hypothetical protein A3F43_02365 [Gammaproteobacteria bacterium RIFCSPHIGHO2_12_FULL_42_10]|nr:MAG: hypothetical protein A3F43_02365 [Gammaproteobacteria bacterium RIFCSPHIGHO2_12_FULL_42_10]
MMPDLTQQAMNRPVTREDVCYLLERYGAYVLYNASDLTPASKAEILNLAEISKHFIVTDCGSSLVASPKQLFSHERTMSDADQTICAMLVEASRRGWDKVQYVGPPRGNRVLWTASQILEEQGKKIELVDYQPTVQDLKRYTNMTDLLRSQIKLQM